MRNCSSTGSGAVDGAAASDPAAADAVPLSGAVEEEQTREAIRLEMMLEDASIQALLNRVVTHDDFVL